jgi:hypothetical protein
VANRKIHPVQRSDNLTPRPKVTGQSVGADQNTAVIQFNTSYTFSRLPAPSFVEKPAPSLSRCRVKVLTKTGHSESPELVEGVGICSKQPPKAVLTFALVLYPFSTLLCNNHLSKTGEKTRDS